MGVFTLVLCSLATVTSCIDASVRIVTKSPKVGPLLIVSITLIPTIVSDTDIELRCGSSLLAAKRSRIAIQTHIFQQCCGSGSGSGRIRNFLKDPE